MLHYLVPTRGNPLLSPRQVIQRLRREFKHVIVDRREGEREVTETLKWLIGFKRRGGGPFPSGELDEKIRNAKRNLKRAFYVHIADSPNEEAAYLQTVLEPGRCLAFGYSSRKNELASAPLRRRCAKALGYCVTTEPPEDE
jgi:hypothetical protein